ncbi:MAG: TraR/DksA family transcriptional regulator [Thermodesulfobacteriota bacterium]|nr:TraR/DksA family transcriptional regulator [Thermodesulfobacteriota bacterium]
MDREKEILEIKDVLLEMHTDLIATLKKKVVADNLSEQRDIGDIFDTADMEQSRDFDLLLDTRDRAKLSQIETALEKMKQEEYGLCEECGDKIPIKRLKAMPFATLCVKCKERHEQKEGLNIASARG